MKASVDKLRWLLAGGSLFLLLFLVAVVGYGRYRAARLWKNRLDKLGVHIEQTTDNVTYSQTIQGRTVFTLRAGKAVQRKDGKTTLHNVQLTLYGKKDGSEDRIYGSEFEYDERAGVARAVGAVEMDLRVPSSLAKDPAAGTTRTQTDSAGRDIHVRTSGLTYLRNLGVAATDQQVLLSYGGLECTAKGAEFNSGESVIHLLADVDLHGALRGNQIQLHAAKADLNHGTNSIALSAPDVQSGKQRATASNAVLQLRRDGSIESAQAEGAVTLQKAARIITAARLESRFGKTNLPEQASLTGGVRLVDTTAGKPMHGSASRLDGIFDADGSPVKWKASGGAFFESSVDDAHGYLLSRKLNGNEIEASLKPGKGRAKGELTAVRATGKAQVYAEVATGGGVKTTQIAADDLNAAFLPGFTRGTPVLHQVVGMGHTRLQQHSPNGDEQVSTGDHLQLRFTSDAAKAGELQLANATEDGNVIFESRPASRAKGSKPQAPISARADRSTYDGATEELTLAGRAEFMQENTSITANALTVNQETGNSDANGNVLATLTPTEGHTTEATHIRAERAHMDRAGQVSSFHSTDQNPARLWQGASQVEAATITIDGKKHKLTARPETQNTMVHAVFASASKTTDSTLKRVAQVERISASSMDYNDVTRIATFAGNVIAQGSTGQVHAQNAQMYFSTGENTKTVPSPNSASAPGSVPSMGGALQKAVIWGNVQLSQPGKTGRGDRLVYTAADSTFLLTGSPRQPPQVVDAERGSVTGAALLFHSGDNKVVVSGSNATAETNVRVHTETGAQQ